MPVEPAIYVNTLEPAYPTSGEPKGQGDNHLRLIKQVLKNTFPQFTGPLPMAHDQVASKEYVMQTAFSSSLPGQAGNAGKALFTDGTTASWQQVYPTQTGNAGKFLSTDGTNVLWSSTLKASDFRLTDGADPTKVAAFVLSGIPTGTTRNYTLPSASGTFALRGELPTPLPTLRVQHQLSSTTGAGSNAIGVNTRALNVVVKNTIAGVSLVNNQIVFDAGGTFNVRGSSPGFNVGPHQAYLYNVTTSSTLVVGQSQNSAISASVYWDNRSVVEGEFVLAGASTLELRHFMTNGPSVNGLGSPAGAGMVNVYAELVITKVA